MAAARGEATSDGAPMTAGGARLDAAQARAIIAPLYEGKALATGEGLSAHADGIVQILRPLRDDDELLTAAYLFAAHDVLRDADEWLRSRFGNAVAALVADLRTLMRVSERTRPRGASDPAQAEALRKMLLAMVNDLRVVLLWLASRLQTLRFFAAAKRTDAADFAHETMQLYAPLANRLGIGQLKWELEDLSFRFLEPETYRQIATWLDQKRAERERSVERAQEQLRAMLAAAGVEAEVSGRPKHIYSIWRKMQTKGLAFEDLYDVRGLRVIVSTVAQCYQVLALVHARYTPIADEFDDYIAKPKPNGYQSLHTVVRDEEDRPLEIQIRTRRMHELAELGVAAHWRYKEGRSGGDRRDDERIAWLRQLLAWRQDVGAPTGAAEVPEERIYVLTPQGRVVELPAGSTPIDFAYHVHTELGHRCRGARVDGVMVPLNTPLATGQTVEIIAAKSGGPSRDWLNPELGYLASPRSRTKVRQWFNALALQQTIAAGREILERELQRLGKTAVKLEELARRLGFASVEDLCAAVPKEDFNLRSIEQALTAPLPPPAAAPIVARPRERGAPRGHVLVVGVDSLLTTLARCCRPVPPDEIVGFVTRGKGVSIHRVGCANVQALAARHPERVIEVTWGSERDAVYPAEFFVLAQDRQGLLRDISEVLAREKLNVIGVNTASQRGEARMSFTVEVTDGAALRRALAQVAEISGVVSVRRR
ncbi:MAG: bifunctional (p)ppGpp synthetase/guanosine-3',5'-bis(diphosphate) 3'-pyrophosphohydrolase [Sutterellaceae bacterium]|nr:bifunctional (p)ppGpp synthetase/guanosine-3',5'-bis(diphosphate) 3'-pyrophosphohydrolase [Burkholderiaceae bacterium]MCX7901475.1 bifunctional (p)ppGpp synthetase/guanosine-3',5'-bis(diphosphate) 3'-pyrophosphohydrolase [Burkholderiaceae bacterium]MDW8428914.1 bifunctional (p)ppGpp synthetase/guanosine-3',5'-bis(diphosphate) 3'-pyrophosphohydrolase [Sutterellaceae bacterium]